MFLYEKDKNNINVYELKENREKIIQFKKQEMEKLSKDNIVYKLLFSDEIYINGFECFDSIKSEYIITEKVKKLKNKLLLEKIFYNTINNKIIIDGLLHNYYEGKFDHMKLKSIINSKNNKVQYLLCPSNMVNLVKESDLLSPAIYEIPYIITLPNSLTLLRELKNECLNEIYDKNIDEQLLLYDFNNEPVGRYDMETINNLIKHKLCFKGRSENGLEISENILKKVKQLHK